MTPNIGDPIHNPETSRRRLPSRLWLAVRERAIKLLTEEDETDAEGNAPALYPAVRRWSPAVVPPLLGSIALALGLALASSGAGQLDRALVFGIPLLFALYVAAGIVYATLLYLAPSDALWLAVLVGGGTLFVAGLLASVAGALVGLGVVAGVEIALLLYARKRLARVAAGTLVITVLGPRYFRTLYPGLNVRLPGERAFATVTTGQRQFTSPTLSVDVRSAGMPYRASASAVVTYAVLPGETRKLMAAFEQWEQHLQLQINTSLQDCLRRWAVRAAESGGQMPQGVLAQSILRELRPWAREQGIWVASVRVRNRLLERMRAELTDDDHYLPADLHSEPLHIPLRGDPSPTDINLAELTLPSAQTTAPAAERASNPVAPVYAGQKTRIRPGRIVAATGRRGSSGGGGRVVTAVPRRSSPNSRPSPDALAATYDAVRERRITDPKTIRTIAIAFEEMASDPGTNDSLPYDAAEAARILEAYALKLETFPPRPVA